MGPERTQAFDMALQAPVIEAALQVPEPVAAPLSVFEQPRSSMELPVNTEQFVAGYQRLIDMGLDPERIAKVVVGGGGKCVGGTIAELMVMPDHADTAASVREDVQEAIASGVDPNVAVLKGLKAVLKRDEETKQLVEAVVPKETEAKAVAEAVKKN